MPSVPRVRDPAKLRSYAKRHYEANREAMIAKAKASTIASRERIRRHLLAFLRDHPCVDCGEADPIVLEFDHIAERGPKLFELGRATQNGASVARIDAEIAKCDVRCANCHRRKTYAERGFSHKG